MAFSLRKTPTGVVPLAYTFRENGLVGRSEDGLPVAVQIAAMPFQDEAALEAAALPDEAFEYNPPAHGIGRSRPGAD